MIVGIYFMGTLQSQKTAELLLDLKVGSIVSGPKNAGVETATIISKVSSQLIIPWTVCNSQCHILSE